MLREPIQISADDLVKAINGQALSDLIKHDLQYHLIVHPCTDKQLEIILNALLQNELVGSIRSMTLSNNQLDRLPECIGQFSTLEILTLSNNRLTHLPDTIGQLSELRALFLDANNLVQLPDTLCDLTHLRKLNLKNNQLQRLPRNMGALESLIALTLSLNRFDTLPDSFGKLESLLKIELDDYNLKRLPATALSWKNKNLLNNQVIQYHYRDLENETNRLTEILESLIDVYYTQIRKIQFAKKTTASPSQLATMEYNASRFKSVFFNFYLFKEIVSFLTIDTLPLLCDPPRFSRYYPLNRHESLTRSYTENEKHFMEFFNAQKALHCHQKDINLLECEIDDENSAAYEKIISTWHHNLLVLMLSFTCGAICFSNQMSEWIALFAISQSASSDNFNINTCSNFHSCR